MTIRAKVKWGEKFKILLSSCRHHDHPCADREMERRHLEEAAEEGAGIVDLGDLFCAMQTRSDPRRTGGGKRPEDEGPDYLNRLVKGTADWYAPWASQWLVQGSGNHETAVARMSDYNLSAGFVDRLQDKYGSPVVGAGYRFWVRFLFEVGTMRASKKMLCIHGSGGGGYASKGALQEHRRQAMYPNADIIASGHIHEAGNRPRMRLWLNEAGREVQVPQLHVQVPTYKDEVKEQEMGWAVEKELDPKPLGAVRLTFEGRNDTLRVKAEHVE